MYILPATLGANSPKPFRGYLVKGRADPAPIIFPNINTVKHTAPFPLLHSFLYLRANQTYTRTYTTVVYVSRTRACQGLDSAAHHLLRNAITDGILAFKGFTRSNWFLIATGVYIVDRNSPIGVATRYGLDDPGIECRWRPDFPHPSRPALGPTQPPIQ